MNQSNRHIETADLAAVFNLEIAGQKVDGRTVAARSFRMIAGDLMDQLSAQAGPRNTACPGGRSRRSR